MLIEYNPDEWEIISEVHTCQFHKNNPGVSWAGCTCSASYSQRKKTELEMITDDLMVRFGGAWRELAKM